MPSPYPAPGTEVGGVSSRCRCVAGLISVVPSGRTPVATVGAHTRRSSSVEIIAPAAQPQDGFQSVLSATFPSAVWFVYPWACGRGNAASVASRVRSMPAGPVTFSRM
ncbi:hypothetical protein GCM10020295_64630 [Streptomyces cinereospinus]